LWAEVGLVEGDVAERGAGAGGRVGAQVDVAAFLVAAEAAGDPGAHGPAFAEAALDGHAQAGVEGVLVGCGAVARGGSAGEPAAARVAAGLPARAVVRRGRERGGTGREPGDGQQQ